MHVGDVNIAVILVIERLLIQVVVCLREEICIYCRCLVEILNCKAGHTHC